MKTQGLNILKTESIPLRTQVCVILAQSARDNSCRHLACVNFLLAHGADPLPIDTAAHGDTALHMACAGAHRWVTTLTWCPEPPACACFSMRRSARSDPRVICNS
jgi:ankyrin repeat protein